MLKSKPISELIDDLILAATVKETYSRWNGETESGYPHLAEARKALEDAITGLERDKDLLASGIIKRIE